MTSIIEAPTTADFKAGQRVAVDNWGGNWDGPATVIDVTDEYVSVQPDHLPYAGAFVPQYIVPLPDSYSVHDYEAMEAVPVGAILRDAYGSEFRKIADKRYSIDYAHTPEPAGYGGISVHNFELPFVLLNPEVLEPTPEPEPEPLFREGDEVVLKGPRRRLSMNAQAGSRAVVTKDCAEGDTYVYVRWTEITPAGVFQMDGDYYAEDFEVYVEPEPEPQGIETIEAGKRYEIIAEGSHGFAAGTVIRALYGTFGRQSLCTVTEHENPGWEYGVTAYVFPREVKAVEEPALELDFEAEDPIKTEQPKVSHDGIAVGDKVRVLTDAFTYVNLRSGDEGEVTALDGRYVKVKVADHAPFPFVREELEKLQPRFREGATLIQVGRVGNAQPGSKAVVTEDCFEGDRYVKVRWTEIVANLPLDYLGHGIPLQMDGSYTADAFEVHVEEPTVEEQEDAGFGLATVHDDEGLDALGNGSVIRLDRPIADRNPDNELRVKVGGKWRRAGENGIDADYLTRALVRKRPSVVLLAL